VRGYSGYLIYTRIDEETGAVVKVASGPDLDGLKSSIRRSRKVDSVDKDQDHDSEFSPSPDDIAFFRSHLRVIEYASIARKVSGLVGVAPDVLLARELENFSKDKIDLIRSRNGSRLYSTKGPDSGVVFRAIVEYINSKNHAPLVRNAVFAGLVASFDNVLASSVRVIIRKLPNILRDSGRAIPIDQILLAKDFASFQEKISEEIVEEVLFKARYAQIQWIESAVGVTLRGKLKSWPSFLEVCERRNVYIHNDSRVTPRYAERVEAQSSGSGRVVEVGDRLSHDFQYLLNAADVLLEMSVLLIQKIAREIFLPDEHVKKLLDQELNSVVYEQNFAGRYESASRIAQTVADGEISLGDYFHKMLTVNHAVAQKNLGKTNRANKILDAVDWSSSMPEFQICVAAVKSDVDKVCELIPRIRDSDLVRPESFFEWPVFKGAIADERVVQVLFDTFGDSVARLGPQPRAV
jgi:hypothetical protein